jgi:AraC-like DNA-binding protein
MAPARQMPSPKRVTARFDRALHPRVRTWQFASVPLRATTSLDAFVSSPIDAFVVRRSFAFWQSGRGTNGLIAWGTPDEADIQEMTEAFDVVLGPHVREHVSLVDVRAIERIEPLAFTALLAFMTSRRAAYAKCTRKQAVVCQKSAFGAAIIGLYHMMQPGYPTAVFYDERQAFPWLVSDTGDAAKAARAYAQVKAHLEGVTPLLARVRAGLEEDASTMQALARELRTSVRTLQRQLRSAGTSFRTERDRARIERAKLLLRETQLTVSAIASRTGFSSPSAFVSAFRRATGGTPGSFRENGGR